MSKQLLCKITASHNYYIFCAYQAMTIIFASPKIIKKIVNASCCYAIAKNNSYY